MGDKKENKWKKVLRLSCIRFCIYQVLRLSSESEYLGIIMNK